MWILKELVETTAARTSAPISDDAFCQGFSIDSRTLHSGECFIAIKGERMDGHDHIKAAIDKGAVAIIVEGHWYDHIENDFDIPVIVVESTILALGQIASAHRQKFHIPVIVVTGSAGKTTTKEMIAYVLEEKLSVLKTHLNFNNHIGVPLTLLRLTDRHDVAVIEIGTNQPGDIAYLSHLAQPTMGVITNIGPSHLEKLESVDGVFEEKLSLIQDLDPDGILIFNRDMPLAHRLIETVQAKGIRLAAYGFDAKSDLSANVVENEDQPAYFVDGISITLICHGRHQYRNALAALLTGLQFDISIQKGIQRLESFQFSQSRQEILELNGFTIIDDTYNSNPLSCQAAVDTLNTWVGAKRKVLVIGDMMELGQQASYWYQQLADQISKSKIDVVWACGDGVQMIVDVLKQKNFSGQVVYSDFDKMLSQLSEQVQKGDVVWIKASRSAHFENVVECLREQSSLN